MINAGITGGETLPAGELIRILVNHPDVNLIGVISAEAADKPVTQVHRGLEGDTELRFLHHFPDSMLSKLDVVFLCGEPWEAEKFVSAIPEGHEPEHEPLRLIDLTGYYRRTGGMEYGLPEDNRKALVRGATSAAVPSAPAMALELALFPLVKSALLDGNISATLSMASTENFVRDSQAPGISADLSTRFDPVAPAQYRSDISAISAEVRAWLTRLIPGFKGDIDIRLTRTSDQRGLKAEVQISSPMAIGDIERTYNDAYSDHSFTYVIDHTPEVQEVANTNKCLLNIVVPPTDDPEGFRNDAAGDRFGSPVLITAVIDNLLKGGAGNAVHCMNLLFGLSERTGLALKASAF
ncbi:MAG: hypothetical protein ACI30D_07055 [Muribaculaceae bacterium]